MATEYPVELSLTLRPVGQPWVRVTAGSHTQTLRLTETQTLTWNFAASAPFDVVVEQFDKAVSDPDTAVEITDVSLFGISHPKFVWAGTYWPSYPPHLSNQAPSLTAQSYLSWNGCWVLPISVPVFTWIHRTLDMGWIFS